MNLLPNKLRRIFSLYIFFITCTALASCNQVERSEIEIKKFGKNKIDSLARVSDTVFTEFVGRHDFYTIDHYLVKKDSIEAKVFRDSLGKVVAYNYAINGKMEFVAEYYPNGQIIGDLQLDGSGTGPVTYYYPDGRIRSKGRFKNHNQTGTWKEYNEDGTLKDVDHYEEKKEEGR